MAKRHRVGCPRCGDFLKANSNLRQKLKDARLLVENRDAEVKSLQDMLGEKMRHIEELRREVSQERAAHEQTRSVRESAEKELIQVRRQLQDALTSLEKQSALVIEAERRMRVAEDALEDQKRLFEELRNQSG